MQKITAEELEAKGQFLLYIETPFCGTCHVARSFLEKIERTHKKTIFHEMNASFFPDFMQQYKIESVPCLLIKQDNTIKEKVYTFHSIANIYHYLLEFAPEVFQAE